MNDVCMGSDTCKYFHKASGDVLLKLFIQTLKHIFLDEVTNFLTE